MLDVAVGYGPYSQILMLPNFPFYYCWYITVNGPSDNMEITKKNFKEMSLWTKSNFFYEVQFSLQIHHVVCFNIILIHYLFNKPYRSF